MSRKNLFIVVLLFIGAALISIFTQSSFFSKNKESSNSSSWLVSLEKIESQLYQRGIVTAKESFPVIVLCQGYILELTETGKKVQVGDPILVMDDAKVQDLINNEEITIESQKLALEQLKKELEFLHLEKSKNLEVSKAKWEHAVLIEQYEKSKPTQDDIQIMSIDEELAQRTLQSAILDLKSQQRLVEKGFLSESALKPFELRVETAKTFLNETKLKNEILKRGIHAEKRVELETKTKSAKSTWERAAKNFERLILRKMQEIDATIGRLNLRNLQLKKLLEEKSQAIVIAEKEGILIRKKYRDWRAGGIATEMKPGIEKYKMDVVAEIMDPSSTEIQAAFNEADFHRLRVGMEVEIKLPSKPGLTFNGKVSYLGSIAKDRNKVDPTTNLDGESGVMTYNAKISFESSNSQLRPGMSANLQIKINPFGQRLAIPRKFIKFVDQKAFVRKKDSLIQEIQGVAIHPLWFQVDNGLQAGEKIYVHD